MNIVTLPEAGETVSLALNLETMEALFAKYGDEYFSVVYRRLDLCDPDCLKFCLERMASEPVSLGELVKAMPVTEISKRIWDAIYLTWKGIRYSDEVSGDVSA